MKNKRLKGAAGGSRSPVLTGWYSRQNRSVSKGGEFVVRCVRTKLWREGKRFNKRVCGLKCGEEEGKNV